MIIHFFGKCLGSDFTVQEQKTRVHSLNVSRHKTQALVFHADVYGDELTHILEIASGVASGFFY